MARRRRPTRDFIEPVRLHPTRHFDRHLPDRGDRREVLGAGAWLGKLVLTLLLYSAGNLVMLRLVREFGMASAFSLSAMIQLVAVNVIALAWFGERLSLMQGSGIVLAILAVGLITLGPALSGK